MESLTFIRSWYVPGPGHFWPVLLLPLYGIAELVPSWRKKARSMALVTLGQILRTLTIAVEADPEPIRIIDIRQIRTA